MREEHKRGKQSGHGGDIHTAITHKAWGIFGGALTGQTHFGGHRGKEAVLISQKVILVDDDEQIVKSFQRRLRKQFVLDVATRGAEALDMMERQGPYAVVVSDYRMPEMDGIDFLMRVRERHPDTVRIMLTGFSDLQTAIKAVNESQVFRFLTKPCPPGVLAEAVNQAIKYHSLMLSERELAGLKQWRKSLEQLVTALVRLVESRDPYTAGHQQRVAFLSLAIARELQLDPVRQESLNIAAMLHDVGKVYVPLEFLNKPGRLSEREFNIIKHHPQVGFEILDPVEFEAPVSQMVLQHHERLDGSGYPQGLKDDEIIYEAKILAVADVVEAMSSHRPYRPSRGVELALQEIKSKAGTHYDSQVVSACLHLFEHKDFSFKRKP